MEKTEREQREARLNQLEDELQHLGEQADQLLNQLDSPSKPYKDPKL